MAVPDDLSVAARALGAEALQLVQDVGTLEERAAKMAAADGKRWSRICEEGMALAMRAIYFQSTAEMFMRKYEEEILSLQKKLAEARAKRNEYRHDRNRLRARASLRYRAD